MSTQRRGRRGSPPAPDEWVVIRFQDPSFGSPQYGVVRHQPDVRPPRLGGQALRDGDKVVFGPSSRTEALAEASLLRAALEILES